MVKHHLEAQSQFASLGRSDLQISAQKRLTATLNFDYGNN